MIIDTADLRNPDYHGRGDVFNTLNYESLGKVVSDLSEMIIGIAIGESTLQNGRDSLLIGNAGDALP